MRGQSVGLIDLEPAKRREIIGIAIIIAIRDLMPFGFAFSEWERLSSRD